MENMKNDKNKSLLRNSFFNLIKTFSNLIFPVVTFTYASRILGDTGIGQVNFTKSITTYFTMIAMLGMMYYGTREGAKLRDNPMQFSRFSQEMLIINGCTTTCAYALMIVAMLTVPRLQQYRTLLLVNSFVVLLQGMGMEWMYQAVEEYRYITLRSLLFQGISFAALFLFVRKQEDVVPYAVIQILSSSGSYVLNFLNARKYIRFRKFDHYEIKKHLKPLLWLFAMVVSIELYTVLDSTMLGFLKGDAAVGRYTVAVRINKMMNTLITAAGTVMIPRFSYYIHNKEHEKVRSLVADVYNFVFMLSIPIAVGLFLLSDEIIWLLSGEGFASAGFTMRMLTPIVVIIPFSAVANLQIFVPMEKEKLILQSTMTGAVTNFTFNMLLIPKFSENGAAVATVLAETAVTIVCFWNIGKFYDRKAIFSKYYQYWIAAVSIPAVILLTKCIPIHYVLRLCIAIPVSAVCYFALLWRMGNPYLAEGIKRVRANRKIHYKMSDRR